MKLRRFNRRRIEIVGRTWSLGVTRRHRWSLEASRSWRPDRSGPWVEHLLRIGPLRAWIAYFPEVTNV